MQLGPLIAKRTVRSAQGKAIRPVVKVSVRIKNRRMRASFTVIHRAHMDYPILIGRNLLKKNFLIDPALPLPTRKIS